MNPVSVGSIRNTVVVSDEHCGCKLGLYSRVPIKLDDGGPYLPSITQLFIMDCWDEFWNVFVPWATHGEPYQIVNNGDALEGVHHRATTPITHNLTDQGRIALACLKPIVDRCKGRFYMVRGTGAHVGVSAYNEEKLAEELGAIPNELGQFCRWDLWMEEGNGLIHFLHHIGTTSSAHHEASAVNAEMTAEYVEAARWGNRAPTVIVRSHRHRNIEVRIPTKDGYATGVVTPAWQGKTEFSWRIAGGRLSPPQIGGIVIRADDNGHLYTLSFVRTPGRSAVVTAAPLPLFPEPTPTSDHPAP